jgi:hypothetical protein
LAHSKFASLHLVGSNGCNRRGIGCNRHDTKHYFTIRCIRYRHRLLMVKEINGRAELNLRQPICMLNLNPKYETTHSMYTLYSQDSRCPVFSVLIPHVRKNGMQDFPYPNRLASLNVPFRNVSTYAQVDQTQKITQCH